MRTKKEGENEETHRQPHNASRATCTARSIATRQASLAEACLRFRLASYSSLRRGHVVFTLCWRFHRDARDGEK